jgi:hypothetical protein
MAQILPNIRSAKHYTRQQKYLSFATNKSITACSSVFDADFRSEIRIFLGLQISEASLLLLYIARYVYIYNNSLRLNEFSEEKL